MKPTHAVKTPALSPAPPVLQRAEVSEDHDEVARPLLASLSAVPAVQRACAGCGGGEEDGRAVPVQPRLEVGPVDDAYEREADAIAGRVMALRDPPAVQRVPETEPDAMACRASIQRKCDACATRDDEMPVQPRRSGASVRRLPAALLERDVLKDGGDMPRMKAAARAGGEQIAASAGDLTSGGRALGSETRAFFESRMGRDLSDVRVHTGGDSDALNSSISARAFTYRNHIWLSGSEREGPSFTMAHELAHVLQQTQPGPLSDQMQPLRKAASMVQRNHWLPLNTPSSRTHSDQRGKDLQADLIGSPNPDLRTEVPVPGGTKKGIGRNKCGFADLYSSDNGNIPGAEVYYQPIGSKTRKFRDITSSGNCGNLQFRTIGPARVTLASHGYPRVTRPGPAPRFTGCSKAPSDIRIGDVKPGHNPGERKDAIKQINNYIRGLDWTATRINERHRAADKRNTTDCWTPKPDVLTKLNIPSKWDPNRNGGWDVSSIEFRAHNPARTLKPYGSRTTRTGQYRIKGRYSAVPDPHPNYKDKGIWVYFLEPEPTDLANAFSTAGPKLGPKLKSATSKLEPIMDCLKSTPATSARVCKRPLAKEAKPHGPQVRRSDSTTPTPRPLPSPRVQAKKTFVKDKFDLKRWNARRTGKGDPAFATKNLETDISTNLSEEIRDRIAFQGAVAEGQQEFKENHGPNTSFKLPAGATSARKGGFIANAKLLAKAEFWTGRFAGFFGMLRDKFGFLFGKVATLFEGIKKKAREVFGKVKFRGGGGKPIARAAKKAASRVMAVLGKKVMERVSEVMVSCLETGISRKINTMISGTGIEQLRQNATDAKAQLDTLKDDVFDRVEAIAAKAIKPVKKELKAVGRIAKLVGDIVSVGMTVVKGTRVGLCLSGLGAAGWGAIVTCLASAGDFVLSFFGLSPIEKLAEIMVGSCANKKLIARAMTGTQAVANLPTTVAKKIVGTLRGLLPPGVQDIFCKDSEISAPALSASDFDCSDSSGDGEGHGGGLAKEGGSGNQGNNGRKDRSDRGAAKESGDDDADGPASDSSGDGQAGRDRGGEGEQTNELPDYSTETPSSSERPKTRFINLQIHGGFDPSKTYDGTQLSGAYLSGTDSEGIHYDMIAVDIWIHDVYKKGNQPRIKFKFKLTSTDNDIVLHDGDTGRSFRIYDSGTKVFDAPIRPIGSGGK